MNFGAEPKVSIDFFALALQIITMTKALYDYSKEEILKTAYANKAINPNKPADLARLTAALMLNHPEKVEEIKFMVKLLNKIYYRLPVDKRPKLPHQLMKIEGDTNEVNSTNPNKPLCGVTKDGRKYCVGPVEAGEGKEGGKGGETTWSIIKNKTGQLFVKVGPIVVAVVVFCAFLMGGWMIGLSAVIMASIIMPESTRKVIEKVADITGFILKQAGRAARTAADAIGLTNIIIFGGLAFAAFTLIKAKE